MAWRKRKKSSSALGAFVMEGLALVVFIFLFVQARAERAQESELEKSRFPVIQEMFHQTPFQDLLAQSNV